MTEQTNDNQLDEFGKKQLAEERRKARVFLDMEKQIESERANEERIKSMSRMPERDFQRLKAELFAATARSQAEKLAAAAKKQQG